MKVKINILPKPKTISDAFDAALKAQMNKLQFGFGPFVTDGADTFAANIKEKQ